MKYEKISVPLLPNCYFMQRIYTLLILFTIVLGINAQSSVFNNSAPKHEVRAVWLTTIGGLDWPHSYSQSPYSAEKQKQELRNILDRLKAAKINTVLLQTRIRGTMIYPSQMEPWDGCLSGFPGKGPGYDALQFAIDECHKRGMECHAWVVTIPVGKWNALGCNNLRKHFPGLIKKIGDEGFMNPEDTRTGDYLAKICSEITHNYNIDGIHLDYIRYPETWNIRINRDKARNYITQIVEKIHRAVKQEKPWVKMSCSPIGKFDDLSRYWSHGWNAYTKVCQDAQGWLQAGLMDELFPMMYFRNEQFFPFAIDWAEQSCGKIIAPGLGIYFLNPKEGKWKIEDITSEMCHLRNIRQGYAFFRSKFFLDNTQGIYDYTAKDFNRFPALVPAMTWECNKQPMAPTRLSLQQTQGNLTLFWNAPSQYTDGTPIHTPYIYNNVYASRTYPVDIRDASNLIETRRLQNHITFKNFDELDELYFAITAMDGYGNESSPLQVSVQNNNANIEKQGKAKLLKCDENKVELPFEAKNMDFSLILIETQQGQTIRCIQRASNYINIKGLAPGIYTVKGMNKKGITHSIGSFILKFFEKNRKKTRKNLVE